MNKFLLGHSCGTSWLDAAKECLKQIGSLPLDTNFGFVYATDTFSRELPQILDYLKDVTDIGHWVGGIGMGICCTQQEYYDQPAVTIMLCRFPEMDFRVVSSVRLDINATPDEWHGKNWHFGIIHGDPRDPQLAGLISKFAQRNHFLMGGLISSHGRHLQIADNIIEGGLSGVVFSEEIPVVTGLTQGCSPIGPIREITDCHGNVIIEIDNRPALEVFYQDIGEVLARDVNRAAGYIFAGLPVKGSDTGDYLVRNLMGVDTQNKLIAIGDNVADGDAIMFCRRDAQSARLDMQRMLDHLKARTACTPKGGVYFSCLGRGRNLFGNNSEELKTIARTLGDFPLVGFFANGEISNHRLYSYTGVLALFL